MPQIFQKHFHVSTSTVFFLHAAQKGDKVHSMQKKKTTHKSIMQANIAASKSSWYKSNLTADTHTVFTDLYGE